MTTRIKTPHAAIKIWNYKDRLDADGVKVSAINQVDEEIISTVSCIGIQTFKSKSDPVGTFNFILAPTRNWTSVITPGSWCAIMMSNEPITKESFRHADPNLVKMFGKITGVRADISVGADGARSTRYLVSGQDWGLIFNNTIYIDPLLTDPVANRDTNNSLYLEFMKMLLGKNGTPTLSTVTTNIYRLLSIFGQPTSEGLKRAKKEAGVTRMDKSTHTIRVPQPVVDFFQFTDRSKEPSTPTNELTRILRVKTGKLKPNGEYEHVGTGYGWINPHALVGSHSLWQVLQDNSNYALNELITDMFWGKNGAELTLLNRVKPFSFQTNGVSGASEYLRSKFKYLPTHKLDDALIISLNAGTNWADKFNFIEIKPEMSEFQVYDNWVKLKSQVSNNHRSDVFDREGFRPLIFNVKQVPLERHGQTVGGLDVNALIAWGKLAQEWYFDAHRLLNGQLVMTGSTEYISVGNNIMFDAGLLNITPNHNSSTSADPSNKYYVLAHVESVKHNFGIVNDARTFQTTIQFVRGIIVDAEMKLIGDGAIDSLSTLYTKEVSKNTANIVNTSGDGAPSEEDS